MRKFICCLALICFGAAALGQGQAAVVDSMKRELAKAKTEKDKFEITGYLSRVLMNLDPAEADKYGRQMIELAEVSRDRTWIIRAHLANGERHSYLAGRRENIEKAISYYNKGLEIARNNKIDTLIVRSYLLLSEIHRYIPDPEKALTFVNQANSYNFILKNDSVSARVHLEYGSVYMAKNEKLLALRSLLSAVRIAEETNNSSLLRMAYNKLSVFYSMIEDYDRAIDYLVKSTQLIDKIKTGQSPYLKVQELNQTGDLYAGKKDYDMANYYYNQALSLADSLKFEPIKAMSYRSIVNNYLHADQPKKALDYFNAHPQLKEFLYNVNFGHFVDQSYGFIYMKMEQYDSAQYYYDKVRPFFERDVNQANKLSYYYQLGLLHKGKGETDKSLEYFLLSKGIADNVGNLEQMKGVAEMLDTMYQAKGDYKNALVYSGLVQQYRDSIDKLGKEKDLMQVEAADEQQRQERAQQLKLEKDRRRNNIQYMMITFGILGLFIALVVLGMFKVSATTIRMIGFFAFLMFFEFIFLIFKKNIYSVTNGEPWKDLMFMIGLAAVLLPLHHWLEHKVIHYLTSHNRLTAAGHHIKSRLGLRRGEKKEG